jgi:5-methylcytosine-specific restriction endonuclease McrA
MKRQRHWSYTGEKRRLKVLRRDNWECQIQGPGCLGTATTVDHIHPKAWGGTEDESNLRAACKPCNQSKGARADAVRRPSPFFRDATNRRGPLHSLSPQSSRWTSVVSVYSRKDGE